jgi:hypothetical protein
VIGRPEQLLEVGSSHFVLPQALRGETGAPRRGDDEVAVERENDHGQLRKDELELGVGVRRRRGPGVSGRPAIVQDHEQIAARAHSAHQPAQVELARRVADEVKRIPGPLGLTRTESGRWRRAPDQRRQELGPAAATAVVEQAQEAAGRHVARAHGSRSVEHHGSLRVMRQHPLTSLASRRPRHEDTLLLDK